ncbi:hypothetical protein VRZ08_24880 [Rhodopseudomonas sp. G2_2311]|uniref:hypothetical protein n=1 Tax=Rhodopseudomonas sp. G2_2311 TaxID=3114287 RepID=UPI0039C60CFF
MIFEEIEKRIDALFKDRVRLIAENASGGFSSAWMFWGNRNDFYLGSKTLLGSFKVSLHENGRGYIAYQKQYFLKKREEGISIPAKTVFEWELPKPAALGAVHAASLLLPSDYFTGAGPSESARKKTLVFGVEPGCAAEFGIFLSHENMQTLEPKFAKMGHPIVMVTLENKLNVSIVARSRTFNPTVLPTAEMFAKSKSIQLQKEPTHEQKNLNAMIWNAPKDGEALQVIDVGGLEIRK